MIITFARPNAKEDLGQLKLVVDGYNYPFTGGNFIDLINRKFYDRLPITKDIYENSDGSLNRLILGAYAKGYVEPLTGSFS